MVFEMLFWKLFENFVDLFLKSTKLILRALPEYYKDALWIKLFARKQLFEKKGQKCRFFPIFEKL